MSHLFTMPEKQFHARGSDRAERKDRSNNAIDHQNDGKTTMQDRIVRNIRPKADLYLLHDRFVCRQLSKRTISSRGLQNPAEIGDIWVTLLRQACYVSCGECNKHCCGYNHTKTQSSPLHSHPPDVQAKQLIDSRSMCSRGRKRSLC